MSEYTFLFKENNTDDRDCVNYIEIGRLGKLECGHYFPSINLNGTCFSRGFDINEIDFNNITTILTKEEFEQLEEYNNNISELKHGIKQGDERYNKGVELYQGIKSVIDKLLSTENKELFHKIIEEEKEYVENEYNLDTEDVEHIFNEYGLSYQDRGIVGRVFDDIEECSEEEAESLGYVTKQNERYFDYKTFGEDLLESEQYVELPSGKIAYMNY